MHRTPNKRKSYIESDSTKEPSNKHRKTSKQPRERSQSIDLLEELGSIASISSTPTAARQRSLSIDSVPGTTLSWPTPHCQAVKASSTTKRSLTILNNHTDPVYHPFNDEIEETQSLYVPGETPVKPGSLPVRLLDQFTVYDENGTYMLFSVVSESLLSTKFRYIRASGVVSRCFEDFEDGDSDIIEVETPPLVTLQVLQDFWTDYNSSSLEGIWGAGAVGIATSHAWYILRQPAPLYSKYYQPFWLSHHLTWLAATMIRNDISITWKDFCRQIESRDDDEALSVMGRNLVEKDLSRDYTLLFLKDQLSSKASVKDSGILLKSPLLKHIVRCASDIFQQSLNLDNSNKAASLELFNDKSIISGQNLTVTMPLVHELTTGLFLKTMLKAGKELDEYDCRHKLIQIAEAPDILHPDRPTCIEWENPISGSPGYFTDVSLDGESYKIGDVVMVNPGEDDLIHRARSASEACSQSRDNELVNKVWFCRIIYMFDKLSSNGETTEPTAHVQWYQHGSRTILQETAHPYALFALPECTDVPIGSILGPCFVRHMKPGEEEPHDYHCSFLWDADAARFVDQSILEEIGTTIGHPRCPCCNLDFKRDRDFNHEAILFSETHAEIREIKYHKHDFVYIAAEPNCPYLIGQIRRFIVDNALTVSKSKVELTLLGRFDDIARAEGWNIQRDETRLFLTEQVDKFSLSLIEGKCFVSTKQRVLSQDLPDHFYVDLWAANVNIHYLDELVPIEGQVLAICKACTCAVQIERNNVRAYKACKAPLRTMELFAGAGGLSTGLEQSEFVKTYWAVEISSTAAATFQANHPDAIVYNQDTNVCLQSAINAREGKSYKPLKNIADKKQLPPMPKRGDVDFIIGGFPCQSFSGLNRQRHKSHEDIRTTLVTNMLSYVEFYEPRYVLMENVKGLLYHHSKGTASETDEEEEEGNVIKMSIVKFVLRALLRLGYQTQFRVLQAADYGSPQRRERVIFWGARRPEILPAYPFPTHVTPRYRSHTLKLPTHDKLNPVLRSDRNCAPFRALVVADAISDLPGYDWKNPHVIFSQSDTEEKSQKRPYQELSAVSKPLRTLVGFLEPVDYATPPKTNYQRMLRGDNEQVTLQCSRTYSPHVVERVWHVCGGVKDPHGLPRELWPRGLHKIANDESKLYIKWRKSFRRLKWKNAFATALASCRPFSESIVLHPDQKRIITARECARSQGFPDSFEFVQTDEEGGPAAWAKLLNDIHKQIGNAVPIPLAYALGKSLGKALVTQWLSESSGEAVPVLERQHS